MESKVYIWKKYKKDLQLNQIRIYYSYINNNYIHMEKYKALNAKLERYSKEYNENPTKENFQKVLNIVNILK